MVVSPGRRAGPPSATSPRKQPPGPIALVQEGDEIELDIPNKRLTLLVSAEEMARRREDWEMPAPKVTAGYLARYAAMVGSASEGAILR